MNTHLVYYNWQLITSFYGIVIDHVEEILQDKNNEVTMLTCNRQIKNCFENKLSDPVLCNTCMMVKKIGLKNFSRYGSRFRHVEIGQLISDSRHSQVTFEYRNNKDIKQLEYRDVNIGYGALSSYVSYTRNHEPDCTDPAFRSYFDAMLRSQMELTDVIFLLMEQKRPSDMHVYNGRWADVRPVYDIAKNEGIPVHVLESLNDGKITYYKEVYKNVLPQNISYRTELINAIWEQKETNEEKKLNQARQFFEKRRKAEMVRGVRIYTTQQVSGMLPDGWDSNQQNIVIFNSSEDEFVALGKEYDEFALFENQEEGIKFILQGLKEHPNIHVYLRIHPNLADVTYSYHKRLLKLSETYDNITVIPGNSPISTYTLVDNAEKVLVFTSTVGVEACYWGKPVIMLSGSSYYYLDVGYVPRNKEEVLPLLLSKLEPKKQTGALKFGLFAMSVEHRTTPIRLNPKGISIPGLRFSTLPHLRVFGSALIFRVFWQVWLRFLVPFLQKFSKRQYSSIPTSEAQTV